MGGVPIFYLWAEIWKGINTGMALEQLLGNTIAGLGYELVHMDLSARGRLIRLFIDRPGGVNVDDCAFVSNHLSRVLTVENVDYDRLEVSSPGLDRPLKSLRDFERFTGQLADLKLRLPLNGRKRFVGTLKGVEQQSVLLEVDGTLLSLQMADLDKARLVPNLKQARN
jgi:ribosome maturation factor RimP